MIFTWLAVTPSHIKTSSDHIHSHLCLAVLYTSKKRLTLLPPVNLVWHNTLMHTINVLEGVIFTHMLAIASGAFSLALDSTTLLSSIMSYLRASSTQRQQLLYFTWTFSFRQKIEKFPLVTKMSSYFHMT